MYTRATEELRDNVAAAATAMSAAAGGMVVNRMVALLTPPPAMPTPRPSRLPPGYTDARMPADEHAASAPRKGGLWRRYYT